MMPAVILPVLVVLALGLGRLLAGPLVRAPMHSFLERCLLYWLLGVIAFSWVGTILAGLGLFRWWLVLAILLALIGWVRSRNHSGVSSRSPRAGLSRTPPGAIVVLMLTLAAAAWLFGRPAETHFMEDDSGIYTISGIVLARTGSLFVPLHPFWDMSMELDRHFSIMAHPSGMMTRHYGPFYQWMIGQQPLELGFLPLPKVWTALATWLFGPGLATWAAPFLGLTGLFALYGLCRRLLGWRHGQAAMVLLGASLPQIWFARYPLSEIYAQALLLGGLYLALLARQNAQDARLARHLAFWSGLSLSSLVLVRVEGPVLVAVLAGLLFVSWGREPTCHAGFGRTWLLTLVLSGAYGLAISAGVARHYLFQTSLGIAGPTVTRLALGGLLASGIGGSLIWLRWRHNAKAIIRLWAVAARRLPLAVAVTWMLWAVVALWHLLTRDWGSSLAGWLVQYWTRPGVALGTVGAIWLLWRQRHEVDRPELVALLGLAALLLLLFSANPLVTPLHPWAMRRLVPIVMPALAIGLAGLFNEALIRVRWILPSRCPKGLLQWAGAWMGTACLLVQVVGIGQRSYPILLHHELKGFWSQLREIADGLPPGAVLLFDNGDVTKGLTQPLELLFGHPSLSLRQTPVGEVGVVVDEIIEKALSEDRAVYLVITDGDLAWRPERWRFVSQGPRRIDTTVVRACVAGRPPNATDIFERMMWLHLYEILPRDEGVGDQAASLWPKVSAAAGSYPYLRGGFHGWDMGVDGQIARWTRGSGLVVLPWPGDDVAVDADFCLQIDVAGGRPAEEEAPRLVVEVEGVALFNEALSKDYAPRRLTIPVRSLHNQNAPDLEIRLLSGTWNPSEYTEHRDQRELGVLLYGIELAPVAECVSGR